ncbi:MAG: hypothetical protein ICV79_25005 [Flavisolibacter sp.]|nr:hypothetical protein [Flavisolibacter sp.]
METTTRLPEDFKEYNKQSLYSNLDRELRYDIAKAIKGQRMFSRFSAWDFNGLIWWDETLGYWCCEVSKYRKYVATHANESLEALIEEVQARRGNN